MKNNADSILSIDIHVIQKKRDQVNLSVNHDQQFNSCIINDMINPLLDFQMLTPS